MKPKTARNVVRILAAVALMLTTLVPAAFAAGPGEPTQTALVCYPTAVTRSEDGSEVKKMYDLSPTDDPAGIPRSDFEQDGYHYYAHVDAGFAKAEMDRLAA